MDRDEYGHYVNVEGVEIKVSTDKNGRDHIDIYDSCPAENPEHESIHINFNSDVGEGTIVDTTRGEKFNIIYDYIYDNVVNYCVEQIEQGNYDKAYSRYKNSVLTLEKQFARPKLEEKLVKILKLKKYN